MKLFLSINPSCRITRKFGVAGCLGSFDYRLEFSAATGSYKQCGCGAVP